MKRYLLSILLCITAAAQLAPTGGTKNVTTSGTAVALVSSPTPATHFTVQAKAANTGTICVGASTVLVASKNGRCLAAGQAAPWYAVPGNYYDLSTFYIDASVNGEGVSFDYVR